MVIIMNSCTSINVLICNIFKFNRLLYLVLLMDAVLISYLIPLYKYGDERSTSWAKVACSGKTCNIKRVFVELLTWTE